LLVFTDMPLQVSILTKLRENRWKAIWLIFMGHILNNVGVVEVAKEIKLVLHSLNTLLPQFNITTADKANVLACSILLRVNLISQ
jgi:hypothetical protein